MDTRLDTVEQQLLATQKLVKDLDEFAARVREAAQLHEAKLTTMEAHCVQQDARILELQQGLLAMTLGGNQPTNTAEPAGLRPCRPKASLTPTANSHNEWNTSRQSSRSKSGKSTCVLQRARANAQRRALAHAQGPAVKHKGLTSPHHHLTTRNLTKAQTHGAKREPESKEAEEAAATVQKDLVAAGAVVVEAQEATAAAAVEPAAAAAHLEDQTTTDLSSSTYQASVKTDLTALTTNN